LAIATGAVNTWLFTAAGSVGANTDVHGLVQAVADAGPRDRFETATILGGGATAASALAAVAQLGVSAPRVFVRSLARSRPLIQAATRMGVKPQFHTDWTGGVWADQLVISTLPAGQADRLAPDLADLAGRRISGATLLDVAYDPWPSPLAAAWSRAGGRVASGLDMLLHHAGEQFRLMTGLAAPLTVMRAALPSRSVGLPPPGATGS
jgi:shikimate dehydrogenase